MTISKLQQVAAPVRDPVFAGRDRRTRRPGDPEPRSLCGPGRVLLDIRRDTARDAGRARHALCVDVAGSGLVVLSACSHAGIVNVLRHASARSPDRPIHCAMGGFHLAGANEALVPQTVAALQTFAPRYVAAGHCTGWRAMSALAAGFGEQAMAPLAVGKRFTFAA